VINAGGKFTASTELAPDVVRQQRFVTDQKTYENNDPDGAKTMSESIDSTATSLPQGTRIRFLRTLEEGPCEEHPGIIYARAGDFGTVLEAEYPCKEGHWVKWDHWPNAFGARLGEDFEPCYPSIEECVKVIAAKAGAPVNVVAAALLSQSQELGMSAEELVHTQYRTAMAWPTPHQPGLDALAEAVKKARGGDAPPMQQRGYA
jgi:hypothetical protein